MPTLHWIGKDKVINHHREVPFKVLEHAYGFSAEHGKADAPTGSGNMVVHGDNLEALKALLPRYEGRVKCIYIDPPYNTGNEGWVYNDNVNDPKIRRWLHQVVGKEGEDLSRHDKWLCMMYPRLVLLHKLLAEDGAIWVSIDDSEAYNLKLLMDEVFGAAHFIGNIVWQHSIQPKGYLDKFSLHHNYTLCYQKSSAFQLRPLSRTDKDNKAYLHKDSRGRYRLGDLRNALHRPNLKYDLETPSGMIIPHPEKGWRYSRETMAEKIEAGEVVFSDDETRVIRKIYLDSVGGRAAESIWFGEDVGTTREANGELKSIFPEGVPFDTPKPTALLSRILEITADPNAIILDSFAGSGTTAHTVLNLNKQDGGDRKFILVEMEDYAETITAERVRRVMQGYGSEKKKVAGTGGTFDYYTLGPRLFDAHHNLNEEVAVEKIREYVWYTETRTDIHEISGQARNDKRKKDTPYLLGKHEDTAYYFVYEKDRLTVLDYDTLALLKTKAAHYVIYADNCILPQRFLEEHHITFKKIPRDISRF
jgi:adenine-specific DNA-methyltransferase